MDAHIVQMIVIQPPVRVEVNKRVDIPFPAKAIGGIVVMGRVQADIPDRDVRIDGPEFPQGNNGADAVMHPGVREADMERQVNADIGIVRAEHVKGVTEIKDFLIAVSAPVCVRIGEMAFTGAAVDGVYRAFADFMSIRRCVGMNAGAVAGNGNAVCGDESVFKGRDEGNTPKNVLEPFFIMERKNRMLLDINRKFVRNACWEVSSLFWALGMVLSSYLLGKDPFCGYAVKIPAVSKACP